MSSVTRGNLPQIAGSSRTLASFVATLTSAYLAGTKAAMGGPEPVMGGQNPLESTMEKRTGATGTHSDDGRAFQGD